MIECDGAKAFEFKELSEEEQDRIQLATMCSYFFSCEVCNKDLTTLKDFFVSNLSEANPRLTRGPLHYFCSEACFIG